jgi:DNA-3-methyladenine glycosylase I
MVHGKTEADHEKQRCEWAGTDPDNEWGVPLHDDNRLFELFILEGMQAGLSWITILKKRRHFRHAFDNFNPKKIAGYNNRKILQLLSNKNIIRNRLKIEAAVNNARAFLNIQKEFGCFDSYIWKFVNNRPVMNKWKTCKEIPSSTKTSVKMSKELNKKGFKFAGPTICYSFMQAAGMVNDHTTNCFRYNEILQYE